MSATVRSEPHTGTAVGETVDDGIRFTWWLVAIAVGAAAVRVAYILLTRTADGLDPAPGVGGGDAFYYHEGAKLLWEHGFVDPRVWLDEGRIEESANHPPLYFIWLSLPSVVGITSAGAHMLWSAVLGVTTVVLVGLLGREVAGARVGLVAAGLAAVYPNVWSHDGFLASETIAITATTLTLWLAYRYWRRPSLLRIVAVSFAAALAALSRAELALLFLVLVVPLVVGTRTRSPRDRLRWLTAAALAALVLIGPWVAFNLARFERPVLLSTGFEITLHSANCDLTYYGDFVGYWSPVCSAELRERAVDPLLDQSEEAPIFRDEALEHIGENRGRLPVVVAARVGRITGVYQPYQQLSLDQIPEGRERGVARWSAFAWYPVLALAIAGALVLRARRVVVYPLLAAPASVLFAVVLTFATNRYRATAETAFCVLAAVAIVAVADRVARRRPAPPAEQVPRTASTAPAAP